MRATLPPQGRILRLLASGYPRKMKLRWLADDRVKTAPTPISRASLDLNALNARDRLIGVSQILNLLQIKERLALEWVDQAQLDSDEVAFALRVTRSALMEMRLAAYLQLERAIWDESALSIPVECLQVQGNEEHSCSHCEKHQSRWQLIRMALMSSHSPKSESQGESKPLRSKWELKNALPSGLWSSIQGLVLVGLLTGLLVFGPRFRMEVARLWNDPLPETAPLRGPLPAEGLGAELVRSEELDPAVLAQNRDDFSSEEDEDASPNLTSATQQVSKDEFIEIAESGSVSGEDGQAIGVTQSDIWRFMLKSEDTQVLRQRIAKLLESIGNAEFRGDRTGIQAPGGIQFDLYSPVSKVQKIKSDLEGMVGGGRTGENLEDRFTWYKSRSKQKSKAGYTRVVIWISQI